MNNQATSALSPLLRDVETASQMMRRYYIVAKETMRAMAGYLPAMRIWSAKKMLARHVWYDAMHADMLRSRTLDLRYPRVDVDHVSDFHLIALLRSLPGQASDEQFLHRVYQVIKPAFLQGLQAYLTESDPLDDAPSHAYLKRIIAELQEELAEFDALAISMDETPDAIPVAELLERCGGVHGPDQDTGFAYPERYTVPMEGGRDPSWEPAVMQVPPRAPLNTLEQRLYIAIDHANEVWASETPAALIWTYENMRWELYFDAARWTYDEMRHAMMGEQRLKEMGFEIGIDVPMVPDHWRAFRQKGVAPLVLLLHGLEQRGPLHKSKLRNELRTVNDLSAAQDCDYDWADESNHISFGLAWIKAIYPDWDKEKIMSETQAIVTEWIDWMKHKHENGEHGYEKFMARIEAKTLTAEDDANRINAAPTHFS